MTVGELWWNSMNWGEQWGLIILGVSLCVLFGGISIVSLIRGIKEWE